MKAAEWDEYGRACDLYMEEQRFTEAFSIFHSLAERGNTESMTMLAAMYSAGEGVDKNIEKSMEWNMKAIHLGNDPIAKHNLAIDYRDLGDFETAQQWFKQAVDDGYLSAAITWAEMKDALGQHDDAIKLLEHALNGGEYEAALPLVKILLREGGELPRIKNLLMRIINTKPYQDISVATFEEAQALFNNLFPQDSR